MPPPVRSEALEQVLLRVSEMVCALPQLREMDINPLIVDEAGAVAVDARMVVAQPGRAVASGRQYGHLAILPVPGDATNRSGRCVVAANTWCAHPARTMRRCCSSLVQRACRRRAATSALSRSWRSCRLRCWRASRSIDYDREMALVAVQARAHRR